MKKCYRCGLEKPKTEFNRNHQNLDGLGSYCKRCNAERAREYRKRYPERWKEATRKYNSLHHDRLLISFKKYRETHSEERKKYRESRANWNKDYQKKYYQDNKDKIRTRINAYYKNNPHKSRIYVARRRAKKNGLEVSYSHSEWIDLCNKYGNKCLCCGSSDKLQADHVVPLSKGGHGDISNIQPLCKTCNSKKHDKTIDFRNRNANG